jgi:hypothetical protein
MLIHRSPGELDSLYGDIYLSEEAYIYKVGGRGLVDSSMEIVGFPVMASGKLGLQLRIYCRMQ